MCLLGVGGRFWHFYFLFPKIVWFDMELSTYMFLSKYVYIYNYCYLFLSFFLYIICIIYVSKQHREYWKFKIQNKNNYTTLSTTLLCTKQIVEKLQQNMNNCSKTKTPPMSCYINQPNNPTPHICRELGTSWGICFFR